MGAFAEPFLLLLFFFESFFDLLSFLAGSLPAVSTEMLDASSVTDAPLADGFLDSRGLRGFFIFFPQASVDVSRSPPLQERLSCDKSPPIPLTAPPPSSAISWPKPSELTSGNPVPAVTESSETGSIVVVSGAPDDRTFGCVVSSPDIMRPPAIGPAPPTPSNGGGIGAASCWAVFSDFLARDLRGLLEGVRPRPRPVVLVT
uniref:Putative mitogen-activated protein kinase kinase kinase 1 n=1 Tax=Anopheles marajoara TaxID=58244 RepID=A0A2M4C5S8_9DIPT